MCLRSRTRTKREQTSLDLAGPSPLAMLLRRHLPQLSSVRIQDWLSNCAFCHYFGQCWFVGHDGPHPAPDRARNAFRADLFVVGTWRLSAKRGTRLVYYAFDLLYLDGFDLRGAALIERKRVLRDLLARHGSDRVLFCEHLENDGAVVLAGACELGLEGIVSKRRDAPYRSGKRPEWIKTKCTAWREANRERWREME